MLSSSNIYKIAGVADPLRTGKLSLCAKNESSVAKLNCEIYTYWSVINFSFVVNVQKLSNAFGTLKSWCDGKISQFANVINHALGNVICQSASNSCLCVSIKSCEFSVWSSATYWLFTLK